jgi:N-acetylglucosamine-6-sulfatase
MGEYPNVSRRALLARVAALGVGLVFGQLAGCSSSPAQAARSAGRRSRRPNVIVIMADDMRSDEAPYMPNLQRHLVGRGTTFAAARHNIALCSPARAGFLTGQYSKRHRVRSQHDTFAQYNDVHKTCAVWMQASGYHTGIIGKYFTSLEGTTSPPGWEIRRQLADKSQEQHGYRVWDGTRILAPPVDQTRYLQREVVTFLDGAREPFFLWFTPTADHTPFQAPPAHEDDYARVKWPDRREKDVGDKPPWIQHLSPFPDRVLASMRRSQRLRLRELLGLDDTIAAIVRTLQSTAMLDNTVIIFTSDNGTFWGEHRIPPGSKNMPYDPAVLVPCIVRGPGFPHTAIRQPVHMSMDLTATCVELAEATPDLALDGISLAKVVTDPSSFDDRQLLYDRDDREGFTFPPPGELPPPAEGIFTRHRKLIRYERTPPIYELYDLDVDPNELHNVADRPEYAEDRISLEVALDRLLAS